MCSPLRALALWVFAAACAPASSESERPFAGVYDTSGEERCVQRSDPAPRIEGFGAPAEIVATGGDGYTLTLPSAACSITAIAVDDALEVAAQDCAPDELDIHGTVALATADTLTVDLESTEHWPATPTAPDGIVWTCTHAYTLVRAS